MECTEHAIDLFGCVAGLLSLLLVAGAVGGALWQLRLLVAPVFDKSSGERKL